MRSSSKLAPAMVVAAAFAAASAFAAPDDGSCAPAEDGVARVAAAVGQAMRLQSFVSVELVQRLQETTFDLRQANDTLGRRGVISTESFTQAEIDELDTLEKRMPPCVAAKANIRRAYRARRGIAAERMGIIGIAYAYNNGTYNPNPDGSAARGGQIVVTDLFFDRQAFDRRGTGDEQMQVAMGWSTCQPAEQLSPERLADVRARVRELPAPLRRLTRERILFHEYIHGVTHEQEGEHFTDPSSLEGFFANGGAARFDSLRRRLFQRGGTLEQLNARLREARSREAYCGIYKERADYLRAEGVPQRWPGDTHALDDRDEYVTILIETMMFDPDAARSYAPAERAWAENWWNFTFNPAYRRDGNYRRIRFGECPAGGPVAQPQPVGNRPAANAYGAAVNDYFGY